MCDYVSETCMLARDFECLHCPLVARFVFARKPLAYEVDATSKIVFDDNRDGEALRSQPLVAPASHGAGEGALAMAAFEGEVPIPRFSIPRRKLFHPLRARASWT
jgi:hypothetical protein